MTEIKILHTNIHNPGELSNDDVRHEKLNALLDLKPKLKGTASEEAQLENLKSKMRQECQSRNKTWDL